MQTIQLFCAFYAFFVPPLCCCDNRMKQNKSRNLFRRYGRYINFICLFGIFVIIPIVSLIHNIIFWKVYFAFENIMRPWHLCYALINAILIATFFIMAKTFIYAIRENLAQQDVDSWNDHVDDLLHYTKSENAV